MQVAKPWRMVTHLSVSRAFLMRLFEVYPSENYVGRNHDLRAYVPSKYSVGDWDYQEELDVDDCGRMCLALLEGVRHPDQTRPHGSRWKRFAGWKWTAELEGLAQLDLLKSVLLELVLPGPSLLQLRSNWYWTQCQGR